MNRSYMRAEVAHQAIDMIPTTFAMELEHPHMDPLLCTTLYRRRNIAEVRLSIKEVPELLVTVEGLLDTVEGLLVTVEGLLIKDRMVLALLVAVDGPRVTGRIRHFTCRRIITVHELLIKGHKRPITSRRVLGMDLAHRVLEVLVVGRLHLFTTETHHQNVAHTLREMELAHHYTTVVRATRKLLEM
ncbi:hypothetical protein ANCDUO_20766 [Ancylostoma duodenale]|uniref:Uncharacterized protein n=1 Tax=Ancylostoma duodenale TaxID=51022 RepID=A0A0C2FKP7_9BILA|nr:hypothetical protein ANCDUO_20766 [Ancylostoma duodenale]